MKGIILAGGSGTRLYPLTKATSKQLLPVYDRPMVFYPLQMLLNAGIKEILIIVTPERAGDYLNVLGSGKEFGARFTFEIQTKPEGLAQAFHIGEHFLAGDDAALILGDNIFEDDLSESIRNFKNGAQIFTKKVSDPERFGVVKFDQHMNAVQIVEKPQEFLSDYAITGLYLFDNRVVNIAKNLKPSARNEYEITDLHNWYLENGALKVTIIDGEWIDAGTIDSLHHASQLMYRKSQEKKKKENG